MLGVATDQGLIPEPEAVIDGFHEELEALRAEMRQRLMDTAIQFDILPPAPQKREERPHERGAV
jgi:hypothetical protein